MLEFLNTTEFHKQGFLFCPQLFSASETEGLRQYVDDLLRLQPKGTVYEEDGTTVRALHGLQTSDPRSIALVRHPMLLKPAQQILGAEVYIHQFKINIKAAFRGDAWPWHQDYVFWQLEDGMQRPDSVNVVLFVDEVNAMNGPLCLIPGSHRDGVLPTTSQSATGTWKDGFSAKLKYELEKETVGKLIEQHGYTIPMGLPGSVLFFHPNLAHASPSNVSPFDRKMVILTFNSVHNVPTKITRPEFIVERDFLPLTALELQDSHALKRLG